MKENNYQNLKIAITDEVQLKAVCEVLKTMKYRKVRNAFCHHDNYVITRSDGYYSGVISDTGYKIGYKLVTLTDLLALRDKQFKEKINLAELKEM